MITCLINVPALELSERPLLAKAPGRGALHNRLSLRIATISEGHIVVYVRDEQTLKFS